MSNLLGKIMNIPLDNPQHDVMKDRERTSYKLGHRDARHAAAELALETDQQREELRGALEQMIKLAELSKGLDAADWQAIERARTTLKETSR